MLPLVESFAIDRLAYLLRAGGAHAAHGLVEFHALGFKLESAEIKKPSHVAFQISDDILVVYA